MNFLRYLSILMVLGFHLGAGARDMEIAIGGTPVTIRVDEASSQSATPSQIVTMVCRTDDEMIGHYLTARPNQTEGMPCIVGNPINGHAAKGILEISKKYRMVCDSGRDIRCFTTHSPENSGQDCSCDKHFKGTLRPPMIGDGENTLNNVE